MTASQKITNAPRGIRNNNPGNIRAVAGVEWQGQIGIDAAGFVIFDKPENGYRAMARVLDNYRRRGVETVAEIIATWAPASENQTADYVAHVASKLNVDPFEPIGRGRYVDLLAAITLHENGQQPYDRALIEYGVSLA